MLASFSIVRQIRRSTIRISSVRLKHFQPRRANFHLDLPINYKNLKCEIETSSRFIFPVLPPSRSTIRISSVRLKPRLEQGSPSVVLSINYKNLKCEIETCSVAIRLWKTSVAINYKNLKCEIETTAMQHVQAHDVARSTIRISSVRLKQVHALSGQATVETRSTIRISSVRLKPYCRSGRGVPPVPRSTIRISSVRLKLPTVQIDRRVAN